MTLYRIDNQTEIPSGTEISVRLHGAWRRARFVAVVSMNSVSVQLENGNLWTDPQTIGVSNTHNCMVR